MAVITWGKPKIEICAYVEGALPQTPNWVEVANPKEGTTRLETAEGTKTEATGEGGLLVDSKRGKNKYTFSFTQFVVKNYTKPIVDVDGVVTTNYAVRWTPEDSTLPGRMIKKAAVSVTETYSTEEGGLVTFTFEALEPDTGNMLESYTTA